MVDTGELRIYRRTDEHGKLLELTAREQPADIAESLLELDEAQRIECLRLLSPDQAGAVLAELSPLETGPILRALSPETIALIVAEMDPDDAADLLAPLAPELRTAVLNALPEHQDRTKLTELLAYDPETAGGLMSTDFITVRVDMTMDQAIQFARRQAHTDAETIYYLFVTDTKGVLIGVLSLRDLILAPPEASVRDRMTPEVIAVALDTDQEEVARVIAKYDLLAVPVVDRFHRLRGIVTVDDVVDVLHEEAAEDLYSAGGVTVESHDEEMLILGRIRDAVKARLPWLLVTCLGGMLAGSVVHSFQRTLDGVTAAAMFMPLLAGMGGNVGTQSVTIVVRGMATGYIDKGEILKVVLRESRVGVILGCLLGVAVFLVAWFWHGDQRLGMVVGLALMANMTTAATVGALTPQAFRAFGIDPAVASGPFITTSIDVVGLTIYFTLISVLM